MTEVLVMSDDAVMVIINTVRLACFIVLAIAFDKWWLVLFAPLFCVIKH